MSEIDSYGEHMSILTWVRGSVLGARRGNAGEPSTACRLSLRHNRDFRNLWTGQTISSLGTSVSSFAYPLVVLDLTCSPAMAGMMASVLAGTVFVLRLPAGLLADHVERRRLMLLCDAGRFFVLSGVAGAALFDRLTLAHLLLASVVQAALGVCFAPAEGVMLRRIVPGLQLREAVTRNEVRRQVAALVGPPLGGGLLGLSRAWPFLADALSHAISWCAVAAIKSRCHARNDRPSLPQSQWKDLVSGLLWLWGDNFLRPTVLWLSAAGAVFTSVGLIALVLADELGATPAQIGVMSALAASGGVAGALLAHHIVVLDARKIITSFAWITAFTILGLLCVSSVVGVGLLGAAAFLLVPSVNVVILGYVAEAAPDHIHARVLSATLQLSVLLHPLAPAIVGIVLDVAGTTTTIWTYGAMSILLALIATKVQPREAQRRVT